MTARFSSLCLVAVMSCYSSSARSQASGSQSGSQTVPDARFVFIGSIVRLRATTMPIVPVSDSTIVVRVERLIDAPEQGPNILRRRITLFVSSGRPGRVGDRATFFANGWLIGNGVALREVARQPAGDPATIRSQLVAARQLKADRSLRRRLDSADVVIVGSVRAVDDSVLPDPSGRITEHDPEWRPAHVVVQQTLKGNPVTELTVLFPSSTDIAWEKAPKLQAGQRLILVLRTDQSLKALTIRDAADVLSLDQLDRVRGMLAPR